MFHLKRKLPHILQSYLQPQPQTTNEISENDRLAYLASQSAYNGDEYTQKLREKGYKLQEQSDEYKVFSHPSKKGIISFRGTTVPKDFYSDLHIAHNSTFDPRFSQAANLAKKYPDYLVTGHSLGGSLAVHAGKQSGNETIVFNPGSGMYGLDYKNAKVFKSTNDIISDRLKGDQPIYKVQGDHSLNTFNFLDDNS